MIPKSSIQPKAINLTPNGIPSSLQFAFQEYNFEELLPEDHAFTIIERTLAYGNRQELHWLFSYYGAKRLLAWLKGGGWRTLPSRRLNLWMVYFKLPPFPKRNTAWPH